jgi:hypothetical protein
MKYCALAECEVSAGFLLRGSEKLPLKNSYVKFKKKNKVSILGLN